MDTLTAHPAAERPSGTRPAAASDGLPLLALVRDAAQGHGRLALVGGLAGFGLLCLLFAPTLGHFVSTWMTDENYSHGFLVPLLSLYFANEAARHGAVPVRGGLVLGVLLLLASVLGRLLTTVVPVGIVSDVAFLLGLAGLVAALAGTAVLRRYGFSLFFLIFMVPLPVALYAALAGPLQRLVTVLSGALLNACGIPVLCQGNMMTLPGDVQLFVAEACSGMRQLTGFLALTTAVAYLSNRPAWYRAAVVAASIPIALTANVLRVTLTGMIAYHIDPELTKGQFHTAEGLLMMGVGLALLAGFCSLLNAVSPAPAPAPVPVPVPAPATPQGAVA